MSASDVDGQVEALITRMTLDEKLAQIAGVWFASLTDGEGFSATAARDVLEHGTGHVTRIGASTGLRPAGVAQVTNEIQRYLVEHTRLGIPALVHEEGIAGLCARDATQFPQAIGQAATWNPVLVEELAGVVREQMRAVGARQVLSPVLDVARDPRWGRTEETYGEDPYLVARMGVAFVRGIQTGDLTAGVVATAKHFLGYSMSEGGLNHAPVHVGPRELREVFAAPFQAAIAEAELGSVMNSYADIDGLPCGGSKFVLDELLRGELGFAGCVVADYFTVRLLETFHKVAGDLGQAAARALEAGLDVELPNRQGFGEPLREQIEAGAVSEDLVDRATRRALRHKVELGLFADPFVDVDRAEAAYDTPSQRELARTIAGQSIVLLKNSHRILPVARDIGSIAVVGPAADDPRLLQGDYSYPAHLEIIYGIAGAPTDDDIRPSRAGAFAPGPFMPDTTTLADGIRAVVGAGTHVRVERGCDVIDLDRSEFDAAVAAAYDSDVAVVAVGGRSGLVPNCTSGEFRDASDLGLTGLQQHLVDTVIATGTPTIVVLVGGRIFAVPELAENAAALLEAWIPGQAGGAAIADVLFGSENPSGRLPISMPRAAGQVPVYAGHKSGGGRSQMLGDYVNGPTTPLFPFGFGLSYTTFEYSDLESLGNPTTFDPICVRLTVTNVGPIAGTEVAQLYVRDTLASVTRPVRTLAGSARVRLEPGDSRTVSFEVDPALLAFWNEDMRRVVEPGDVEIMAAASSQDVRLDTCIEIGGRLRELDDAITPPTRVEIV